MSTPDIDACEMLAAIYPTRLEAALDGAAVWAWRRGHIRFGDTADLARFKLQGRRARRSWARGRVPDARRRSR